jgi:hypothetical protein
MKHSTVVGFTVVLLLLPLVSHAQESILRLPPFTISGEYLNQQMAEDTAANGKLPDRVYELQRGGLYLANAMFTNYGNWTLRLRANDSTTTKKPVVMLYPTGTGSAPWRPPGNLFQLNGRTSLRDSRMPEMTAALTAYLCADRIALAGR